MARPTAGPGTSRLQAPGGPYAAGSRSRPTRSRREVKPPAQPPPQRRDLFGPFVRQVF